MAQGPRSRPPDLPNFEYESWLGGGGFADVFLYRQRRPARQVAIKVLRTDELDAAGQRAFDGEADLMARVSAHPYIVTIFGADVAPDGRPYLVMEYYSKPNYARRIREGTLAVQEVLRVGVRIASAVETAHRAGILHRDIKPANILVNEYDRPGLTDFGIAGALEGTVVAEAQGVTVAYAPPEVLLDQHPGDEKADVYALGATLYALLAGNAPFEIRGGDNSAHALLQRTLNTPVAPLQRSDIPPSLEFLLAHAMAKSPAQRPTSAASFAHALQGIERDLRLAPTDFELAGADPLVARPQPDNDEEVTRGPVQVVQQSARPVDVIANVPTGPALVSGAAASMDERDKLPVPDAPAAPDTVGRAPRAQEVEASPVAVASPAQRRTLLIGLAAAGLLVVVVVAVLLLAGGGTSSTTATTTTVNGDDVLVVPDTPAVPTNVAVTVAGGVATVTWDAPDATSADSYLVERSDGAHSDDAGVPAASSPAQISGIADGERVCFKVLAQRGSRQSPPSKEACST